MGRRIIDLTHTLYNGLDGFPGNYKVELEELHVVPEGGYHVTKVTLDTHLGTHIDIPVHVFEGGDTLENVNLNACIGDALVIDMTKKKAGDLIDVVDLKPFETQIKETQRVLINTGWAKHFGAPEFFTDFPGITIEAAQWLVGLEVVLVGLDLPSVNPVHHLEVHQVFLQAGVVIIEALANLDKLSKNEVELICLPLKIQGIDGSPARVVAIEN